MFQLTWQDATEWKRQGGTLTVADAPSDPLVSHAGLLCWEEHCVECSMPQCYSTCSLYVPRSDRKCSRLVYGILPNRQFSGLFGFGADMRFRRWAKLETAWPARLAMVKKSSLRIQSTLLDGCEQIVSGLAKLIKRWSPSRKLNGAYTVARRLLLSTESDLLCKRSAAPHAFFLKCFSPESFSFRVQLELVTDVPVFRTSLPIEPGWNQHFLNAEELIGLAGGKPGRLRLSIENDKEVRLIFTWLDFVCLQEGAASISQLIRSEKTDRATPDLPAAGTRPKPAEKIKCVAWDLDNTLWQGVIGDAGPAGVVPSEQLIRMIRQLDERGILQTIVSKNNYDVAWPKVEQLGLADFFLFPAIHWGPKSQSVQQIASELNIGVDSFAVIDDSPFERHEISNLLPQVRVFDPADGVALFEDPAFQVPISPESRTRRLKYLAEAKRKRVHQSWRGDYDQFLKSCHMVLKIRQPDSADHARCVELLQRSNQFNLSGRRYSEQDFQQLMASAAHECFCLDVADDFGGYGVVGFAAFERSGLTPTLVDFVLSCRVAQKMVEATFLKWYAARQQDHGYPRLLARLTVTPRNAPLREVLQQTGFNVLEAEHDQQLLELSFDSGVTVPDVMQIDSGISCAQRGTSRTAGSDGSPSGTVLPPSENGLQERTAA